MAVAPEGYQQHIIKQMAGIIGAALAASKESGT
jgi:hypothetical protein